jgi:excisionase family DNA binding protein
MDSYARLRVTGRDEVVMSKRKKAYSIAEICSLWGLGRTTVYEEIRSGRLSAMKVGRRRLVTEAAIQNWEQSSAGGKKGGSDA